MDYSIGAIREGLRFLRAGRDNGLLQWRPPAWTGGPPQQAAAIRKSQLQSQLCRLRPNTQSL